MQLYRGGFETPRAFGDLLDEETLLGAGWIPGFGLVRGGVGCGFGLWRSPIRNDLLQYLLISGPTLQGTLNLSLNSAQELLSWRTLGKLSNLLCKPA